MKKFFFFFLIVIIFSCRKRQEQCWECTTDIVVTIPPTPGYSVTNPKPVVLDTCNMTVKEMEAFDASNTKTWTQVISTITLTYTSTCNCKLQ